MKSISAWVLCIGALIMTGCEGTAGSKPDGNGNTGVADSASVQPTNAELGSVAPPASWNATEACSVIDKAAMAAIVGQAVTETSLALVHESDGKTAADSKCTYTLADGGQASLMMRWSPIADNSEGAINLARNGLQETLKAFGQSLETIDGLGKATFWAGAAGQLNVFIGEDRFVIISMPVGSAAKDQATALARKLGA